MILNTDLDSGEYFEEINDLIANDESTDDSIARSLKGRSSGKSGGSKTSSKTTKSKTKKSAASKYGSKTPSLVTPILYGSLLMRPYGDRYGDDVECEQVEYTDGTEEILCGDDLYDCA